MDNKLKEALGREWVNRGELPSLVNAYSGLYGLTPGMTATQVEVAGFDPDGIRPTLDFDDEDVLVEISDGVSGTDESDHQATVAGLTEKYGSPSVDRKARGKRLALYAEFETPVGVFSVKTEYHPHAEEVSTRLNLKKWEPEEEESD